MKNNVFIPQERKLVAVMRDRTQRPPKSPLWENAHPNPGVRKVQRSLARFAREAADHSRANLFRMVGMLTEQKSIHVNACALFLVLPDNTLTTVAMHNFNPFGKRKISATERSIVAQVLRTQTEYYAFDVSNDEHYFEDLKATKSQFTVPIFWEDKLVAILSLESTEFDGFKEKAQREIKAIIPSLISDLLVLRSTESNGADWCPWHPNIHSWDIATLLERMCREMATMICPTTMKMTVWYPDYEKDELRVLGTHGYDWDYVSESSLRLSKSQIGHAIQNQSSKVQKLEVEKFVKRSKALRAGIVEAYAINIAGSNPDEKPMGIITCYLTGSASTPNRVDRNIRGLATQGIEYCAYLCSHLIRAYVKQKRTLARAKMQQAIWEHRKFPKSTRFEVAAALIRKVLRAQMQSTFLSHSSSNELRCVQTTGFCSEKRGKLTRSLSRKDHVYSLDADCNTHTVQCFILQEPIRRTLIGNTQERRLPNTSEFAVSHANAEFDPDETVKRYQPSDRSLICVPLFQDQECVGVMRVVRGGYERAFSHLDTKILSDLIKTISLPKLSVRSSTRVVGFCSDNEVETGHFTI